MCIQFISIQFWLWYEVNWMRIGLTCIVMWYQASHQCPQHSTVFGEIFEQVLFSYKSNNQQSNENKTYSKIFLVIAKFDT